MKTIRIQYLTKTECTTDVAKTFIVEVNKEPIAKPEFQGCYAAWISDTVVDMLVPDNFDVSKLGGTVVKSDGVNPIHEFLGHKDTPMVIDKSDTREVPVKETIIDPKTGIEVVKTGTK